MNPPEKIKLGDVYGRFTVIGRLPVRDRKRWYLCRCECGTEVEVRAQNLRSGNTKSCGCLKRETAVRNAKATATRGGASRHPLYHCWRAMVARCHHLQHPQFADYGGRGITVCARWREDPWAFYADMGPSGGLTLDRIDNEGDYEPGNCRWATMRVQRANQRRGGVLVPHDEIRRRYSQGDVTQTALAEQYGCHQSVISRIVNYNERKHNVRGA
jgi:hypothetical protein